MCCWLNLFISGVCTKTASSLILQVLDKPHAPLPDSFLFVLLDYKISD